MSCPIFRSLPGRWSFFDTPRTRPWLKLRFWSQIGKLAQTAMVKNQPVWSANDQRNLKLLAVFVACNSIRIH